MKYVQKKTSNIFSLFFCLTHILNLDQVSGMDKLFGFNNSYMMISSIKFMLFLSFIFLRYILCQYLNPQIHLAMAVWTKKNISISSTNSQTMWTLHFVCFAHSMKLSLHPCKKVAENILSWEQWFENFLIWECSQHLSWEYRVSTMLS